MSSDKKPPKEKTKKSPKEALLLSEKPLSEQIGYFSAVLERVENKVNVIAEGHTTLNEKMDNLGQKVDGLGQKVDVLEMVVRSHSTQIQQLDKKVDSVRDELKKDILRVEAKLDSVIEKVEQHDKDIVFLKTAAAQG